MNTTLIFTSNYGQYTKGTIAFFPTNIAETIVSKGFAKVHNPEIPAERKTSKSKMIKK